MAGFLDREVSERGTATAVALMGGLLKKQQRVKGRANNAALSLESRKSLESLESQGSQKSQESKFQTQSSIIQQIISQSLDVAPKAKRAPRKSAIKLVLEVATTSAPELHKTSDSTLEKCVELKTPEKRFIPRHRPQRGFFARSISGAAKSGFFLLPGIYMFSSLLYSHASFAAAVTRSEKPQPVKVCVTPLK